MIYVFGINKPEETSWRICNHQPDFKLIINDEVKPLTGEVLTRYGCIGFRSLDKTFKHVLNQSEHITFNKQKHKAGLKLMQAEIFTPQVYLTKQDVEYPCMGRKYEHSRGEDINYIINKEELEKDSSNYYTKFIPSISEYRIHIFKGKPTRISKKIKASSNSHPFIRSYLRGWRFQDTFEWKLGLTLLKEVYVKAVESVQTLNLDFGAVDILITKDKKPCILEVNTGPRLNRLGRKIFRNQVRKYAKILEET